MDGDTELTSGHPRHKHEVGISFSKKSGIVGSFEFALDVSFGKGIC